MANVRYRKKPVVIEAVKFTGINDKQIETFTGPGIVWRPAVGNTDALMVNTLEGSLQAAPGDWIIRGVKGEFYPCKPDVFAATYEPALEVAS